MRQYVVLSALLIVGFIVGVYPAPDSGRTTGHASRARQSPVPSSTDAVSTAADELSGVTPGVTSGEWRRSHPDGEWHPWSFEEAAGFRGYLFGHYCGVSTDTKVLPDSSILTIRAAFYVPEPPPSMALPRASDLSSLTDDCILGYVETKFQPGLNVDPQSQLQAGLEAALSRRFGSPATEPNTVVSAPALRIQMTTVWNRRETKIVAGSIDETVRTRETTSKPLTGFAAAYAYLPVFRRELLDDPDGADFFTVEDRPDFFELAVRMAGLESRVSDPMSRVYDTWVEFYHRKSALPYQQQPELPRPLQPSDVEAALRPWMEASRDLSPQRRAAALLAAQFVLEASWSEFSSTAHFSPVEAGSDVQRALEAAGVEFIPPGGPEGIQPRVTWAKEARDLDPYGPIGDAITLMQLSYWHLRELYPTGYDNVTNYVIETGQRYLSIPRDPDTTARMEYAIASAYCDQVLISEHGDDAGEGDTIPPTAQQISRGPAAKREALKYYELMLGIDKNSPRAIEAWRSAWRLVTGLPLLRHYSVAGE